MKPEKTFYDKLKASSEFCEQFIIKPVIFFAAIRILLSSKL